MKHTISGPLDDAELERAKQSLLEGKVVSYGSCSLHPDEKCELIWGVDPYGIDVVAANTNDEAGCLTALRWAASSHKAENHAAEFCY
ncbi:TPA: hypothetical protein ACKPYM_000754 [Stenotrophomonas maltophilia]